MVLEARDFISTTHDSVTGDCLVSRVITEAGTPAASTTLVASGTVRVSVVIPTYNEAANLPHVFDRLPDGLHEVIVVDGRSVDGTVDVARTLRPEAKIVLQNRRGKGNAMACGFAAVTGDVVIMLDADGSADPLEIPRFVAALTAGADFAKGTRFAVGGGSSDITPLRAWGNRRLNGMANLLFATNYTDLCYGYNAFWTRCLPTHGLSADGPGRDVKLWGDGFEIETIINTRIAKAHLKIVEVPSYESTRIYGASNLNTWRDGFRVLRALAVERVNGSWFVSARRRPGAAAAASQSCQIVPAERDDATNVVHRHANETHKKLRATAPSTSVIGAVPATTSTTGAWSSLYFLRVRWRRALATEDSLIATQS